MTENQKLTIESYNNSAEGFSRKIAKINNYDEAYGFFADKISDGNNVLDLACGPAQISKFVLGKKKINVTGVDLSRGMLDVAKREIPDGTFIEHSIIDFKSENKFDGCILGFGIPYLSTEETELCIKNVSENLKDDGFFYISFMNNLKNEDAEFVQLEKTSFGGDNLFEIHYHKKETVEKYLSSAGLKIIREFILDYEESDGSISKDVIFIAQKNLVFEK